MSATATVQNPFAQFMAACHASLESSLSGRAGAGISGATGIARALVLARLLRSANQKTESFRPAQWVCICPNDETLQDLHKDLIELISAFFEQKDAPRVLAFPDWDANPYTTASPSIRVRHARLAALAALLTPGPPLVLLTTPESFIRGTIPLQEFKSRAIHLKVGQEASDRDELLASLFACGYLQSDPVEDPGTFAFRGEILDIFPPGRLRPFRVEFFDNEVERIREFDPQTQRTEGGKSESLRGLSEIILYPAREVIIDENTVPALRENLKAHADDLEIPRSVRDPIMAGISPALNPDHADAWVPFCWNKTESLFNHLQGNTHFTVVEPEACIESLQATRASYESACSRAPLQGLILPPLEKLYAFEPDQMALLSKRANLSLRGASTGQRSDSSFDLAGETPLVVANRLKAEGSSSSKNLVRHLLELGHKVYLFSRAGTSIDRLEKYLRDGEAPFRHVSNPFDGLLEGADSGSGVAEIFKGKITSGFVWSAAKVAILRDSDATGASEVSRKTRAARGRKKTPEEGGLSGAKNWSEIQALADLSTNDAVVHADHGVGRYRGLTRLALNGAPSDFLQIEYEAGDKLYVPVWRLNVIQKYAGTGESAPLDRLGSQNFLRQKDRARESAQALAVDLVRLYAERTLRPGIAFAPPDDSFERFELEFPFDETPDQMKAIEAVLDDLQSGRPMDRLVCGDVGYGKTEVAIRAAFHAVANGKQVGVLVPTTLLATQHESTFKSRLSASAIHVESITRFKSRTDQKRVLEETAAGKIDVLIGTHRVLSKDVRFKDLGLVIIDEEQRFGVEHKELLKTLRVNTHVLTLSATPIPRTLHLALSGLRDISLINTPPVDRLPIKTWVSRRNDEMIATAIRNELARGGQVFFLHNRVQTIKETTAQLARTIPEARFGMAHGQMSERDLESAMQSFLKKEKDVLVCTAIIESGLDIPSANTILVDRADHFGLAQLYQIRGRVGRGQVRAYAYLMTPEEAPITDDARKRLDVIQRFIELGSGFSIASHDLEMRGGGDILGPEQSGHIAAVGYELYMELLDDEIRKLRTEGTSLSSEVSSARDPEIKAPYPAFLPEGYVPEVHQRLALYRRLSSARTEGELRDLESEMEDRFGPIGAEAKNLLWLIRVKLLLKAHAVDILTVGEGRVVLTAGPGSHFDTDRVVALISSGSGEYQLTPDSRLIARANTTTIHELHFDLERLLEKVARRN